MYSKILVPLDGSEVTECALSHVATIAKGCHVPQVVLIRDAPFRSPGINSRPFRM